MNVYFSCDEGNRSREKCGVPFSCCVNDPAVSQSLISNTHLTLKPGLCFPSYAVDREPYWDAVP